MPNITNANLFQNSSSNGSGISASGTYRPSGPQVGHNVSKPLNPNASSLSSYNLNPSLTMNQGIFLGSTIIHGATTYQNGSLTANNSGNATTNATATVTTSSSPSFTTQNSSSSQNSTFNASHNLAVTTNVT